MLIVLSALWLWMAAVYHVVFFRPINPAATLFAGLFLVQAALLFGSAIRGNVVMRPDTSWSGRLGWLIVAYALVIYPLVGAAAGHRYPANPTFGLPCPTTLYTFGVLTWLRPLRWTLFVIPLGWSVIGTGAALKLGVPEDLGLAIAAGLVSLALIYSTGTAPRSARAM